MALALLQAMLNLRDTRPSAKQAFTQAQRWAALGSGPEELRELERITGDLMCFYPRTLEWEMTRLQEAREIHKEQFLKTTQELEKLIAITYLQKCRLEQWAFKDNWASDALGPVNNNVQILAFVHAKMRMIQQSFYYH